LGAFAALQRLVKALEADKCLADSDRFRERSAALDLLDAFDLISQPPDGTAGSDHVALYRRARELQIELEAANFRLYEHIRDAIRLGAGRNALLRCAAEDPDETTLRLNATEDADSYDHLDELVTGVFRFVVADAPKIELSSEMVAYQPTPARHIFEMIRRCQFTADDVFVDIGSGLGHVPLLVEVCTPARAVGIELEPSYIESARKSAADLRLRNVDLIAQDVRDADLSTGTFFYLYTPFRGTILRTVLDRLRAQANTREIRVCTFGPCTPLVETEPWLEIHATESGQIRIFHSRR
jgi:hypothetical protein